MSFQQIISILAAPFVVSVLLVGIHCYLGLHVLARGVIFVDLSLAQVAAFGSTLALLLGYEHHSAEGYFIAFFFTLIASLIFALARREEKQFPQEAIIGVTYAMCSALVILVVDKMAHGAEHMKDLLVGDVLWVTWADVKKTTIIYGIVGMLHFLFRKKLIPASFNHESAPHPGWDFIFYALFGVVITSSVHLAGVLQVFSVLIVPALVSQPFAKTLAGRLIFGWIFGVIVTLIGMGLSIRWDMPSGALVVVCFTIVPILLLLGRRFIIKNSNSPL
jgi:zinc/manganese transport system permease protein